MRIGLLSDIHANLPALEAVLEDMPTVETIVCAGDVVRYNAWPRACVDRIRDVCDLVVQGNHDREVQSPKIYNQNEMAAAGLRYAREQLSKEQLEWLEQLPSTASLADNSVEVVHSHPENQDQYVHSGSFPSVSTHMSDEAVALVLGHTHEQAAVDMSRFDRHGFVINPGSVGQPRDGDPRAAYALLETAEPTIELRRVTYDIDRVITKTETEGLPVKAAMRLLEGR